MQVYSVLRVLTARPAAADIERIPHLLYGHVHPSVAYSTGAWLRDVERFLAEGRFAGRRPVFVGGTGLYFSALTQGLSKMPDIPAAIRALWRERLGQEGPEHLHRLLERRDPLAAATILPADGQRIVRALEVLEASGRSIREWQASRGQPLVDMATARLVLVEPPRAELRARIETRFSSMIEQGAIGEVERLLALDLHPALPAMRAIGVRELAGVIEGRTTLDEAQRLAVLATGQYAKRQSTWFRNQLGSEWQRVV